MYTQEHDYSGLVELMSHCPCAHGSDSQESYAGHTEYGVPWSQLKFKMLYSPSLSSLSNNNKLKMGKTAEVIILCDHLSPYLSSSWLHKLAHFPVHFSHRLHKTWHFPSPTTTDSAWVIIPCCHHIPLSLSRV